MKNNLELFGYLKGKNIPDQRNMEKHESDVFLELVNKNKINTIFAYFLGGFYDFLNHIILPRQTKLNVVVQLAMEKQQHEAVEILLSRGANPILDDGLSFIVVHNYNHDSKMIQILEQNDLFKSWITKEWVAWRLVDSDFSRNYDLKKTIKNF